MTEQNKDEKKIGTHDPTSCMTEEQEVKAAARSKMIREMAECICDQNDNGLRRLSKD
ncbi:hypothetical protein [Paenibacillus solanacearum]|uniref:hypothetical protein n=1 Tax=Paenibacillus solanacearum TaxID=2048548 RepID=UPI001C403E2D|nr:hypothetical protein [Paenibacillus solanacearum]